MIEAGEVVTKAEVTKLKSEYEAAKRDKTLAEQGKKSATCVRPRPIDAR